MASSFLEKLKKGMEIEETGEGKKTAKKIEGSLAIKQRREEEVKKEGIAEKNTKSKSKKTSVKPKTKRKEKIQIEEEKEKPEPATVLAKEEKEKWPQPEGQLAIDVYQNDLELVIQSAIAGVKPENIDISIDDDVITVKGARKKLSNEQGDYFYQECYWGPFSRQIISPVEIDPGRVDASLKDGILTIRIPKIIRSKKKKIIIKG